jgi:parvulin-like peptidyl-prolyl isomerase
MKLLLGFAPSGLVLLSALVSLPACTKPPQSEECEDRSARVVQADEVPLARVGGHVLTRADVLHRIGEGRHGQELTPERERNVLDAIIEDELAYQRALELGLDDDPGYVEAVRRLQIQMDALAREELAGIFRREEIERRAEVGDDEARQYFADHEQHLRTETHVWQILSKSRSEIDGFRARLDAGESFESLAAEPMATHGMAGMRSWDLGYLHWAQIPEPWVAELQRLEVGQTGGIIEGPGGRFWIIRVVDRRISDSLTFEEIEPILVQQLQRDRVESLTDQTRRELREGADVEYLQP